MLKTQHGPKPLINKDMTLTELGLLYLVIPAITGFKADYNLEDCFSLTAANF